MIKRISIFVIAIVLILLVISCPNNKTSRYNLLYQYNTSNFKQKELKQTSPTTYTKQISTIEAKNGSSGATLQVNSTISYHKVIKRDTGQIRRFIDKKANFEAILVNDSTLIVSKITVDSLNIELKNDVITVNTQDTSTVITKIEGIVIKKRNNWFQRNSFYLGLVVGLVTTIILVK
ncbi:MAG: hypothetical protein V4538_00860 [Bacteroidota bacterium]